MEKFDFLSQKNGVRLDVFVQKMLTNVTRSRIKLLISEGLITVNGAAPAKSGQLLKSGDTVCVIIPDVREISVVPENIQLNIVYQDGDIAVINKKQGMVVHPASGSPDGTLVNALLFHLNNLSGINGALRPGIVHRLDKDTSGLIVVAKNDAAHSSLSAQLAEKSAKRIYIALVDGVMKKDEGVIITEIGRQTADRKKMAVVRSGGKNAETHYKVLERFTKYTLVRFELKTGRTHQIRVHSKHIGHPVVGDATYGGSNAFTLAGQLLHAERLILTHPLSGEKMTFEAPLPGYFVRVLDEIKNTKRF